METNIQKMQALLETVRAGSFTRAAERLSYSQSGVSRMVADLEADWGFKVLDRSREGVVLSADGRQVMPAVEALCEEFTRLQRRVDEMRGLMRGKICIGTFSSVATHVVWRCSQYQSALVADFSAPSKLRCPRCQSTKIFTSNSG